MIAEIHEQDDLVLGEELFAALQLYESGKFDDALMAVGKIIESDQGNTSAHSIAALIYERKATDEIDAGNVELGRDLLRLALSHYETIVDLNPRSAADREKLAALRTKLAAGVKAGVRRVSFHEAFRAIPRPYLAATGVFLIALMAVIVFYPGGENGAAISAADITAPPLETSRTKTADPRVADSGLSIYTFPEPEPTAPRLSSLNTTEDEEGADKQEKAESIKIPPINPLELTIVPAKSKDTGTEKAPAKPAPKPEAKAPAKTDPAQPGKEPEKPRAEGATALRHAIELHNAGRVDEAVSAAEQAIELFQKQIDEGHDVSAARRGTANAKKLITVWRQ